MGRNRDALKSGVWYLGANFLVRGMALITTPIFTRLLTKEQFGDYSNFFSWTNIALILITMRMESTLISAKFDYKDKLGQYNFSALTLTAVMTAVWALVINIFSAFFTELTGLRIYFLNLMLIYCFFHAVISFYQITERYFYRYKKTVFISLLLAVSGVATSVLLVLNMQDRLEGRILGGVLPTMVIGAFLFFGIYRKGKRIDFSTWPYMIKICIPVIPHLLSLQVLNSMDRILITRICGPADNALFSVAYSCGHMAVLITQSMNGAFAPWIGDNLNEGNFKLIRKVSKYYIIAFAVIAVLMLLLAPEILLVMGGKSYMSAIYVMPPVALGCFCQFLYTLFVNVEQFKKKTVGMAIASVIAACLNYVLNIIFIPKYGYIAAAYTTLVSYMALMLMHMYLVKRIGYSQAFDFRFVLVFVGVMLLIMFLVNFVYGHQWVRWSTFSAMFLVALFFIYRKKDELLPLYKKIRKKN